MERGAPREREMKHLKRKNREIRLAEIMRKKTKNLAKRILDGSVGDLAFTNHNQFIIATPPRPYNQWKYECAKSDIIVLGPIKQRELCIKRFEKEKNKSLLEKSRVPYHIKKVRPALEKLYSEGLIEGVIGRGSYFDKHGYPIPKDDIDFILLRRKDWSKEEMEQLLNVFRKVKTIQISFIMRSDRLVNDVKSRVSASFIQGSKRSARRAGGIPYEKYVLGTGIGIPLNKITGRKSERLAKEIARSLPKRDMRKLYNAPRLPPKNTFAEQKKKL
jgi:hypothetical protein